MQSIEMLASVVASPVVATASPLILTYVSAVTAFIALQNRSPQSTFAWVLLFVLFPPVAFVLRRLEHDRETSDGSEGFHGLARYARAHHG
jgi:hypothetical protein